MSKPPKTDFMALIAGDVAPAALPAEPEPVVTLKHRSAAPKKPVGTGNTLKERAHQLSVYLEAPVYDRLRDIAHEERTKLHPLVLEAIDLLLKKRGAPSIRELTRKAS
jgi:hypothetical protein